MASPADQLSAVQTNQQLAAQVQAEDPSNQSEIEVQAQQDALSVENRDVPVDTATATDDSGALTPQKNIAATKNSIFANADPVPAYDTLDAQRAALEKQNPEQMNAAVNSIYSGNPVDAAATDTATVTPVVAEKTLVPVPSAQEVSQVQELAMLGVEIPVIDPLVLAEQPALPTDVNANPEIQVASADPASAETRSLPDQMAIEPAVVPEAVKPVKKRFSLADLFRKKPKADFDADRFGKRKRKTLDTQLIPNMQTAALGDRSLPGVNTNAMFPTGNLSDDELSEGGDEPEGLMKLASLSGMTRMAPNGLLVQTDKVEVRCLRPQLVQMLKYVESHYNRPVIVTSGFRDVGHNRRAGGVRHSLHTLCAAADIQIEGVSKWQLADYLRSIPGRGGVGTYCHTNSVHIDVGEERDWNWRCRRKKSRRS